MPLRRFLPRYSLRTLLASTLMVAVGTHIAITTQQHQLRRRREVVITDVHAQLAASQRLNFHDAQRFLDVVEKRISRDADILTAAEERHFRRLIAAHQFERQLVLRSPK